MTTTEKTRRSVYLPAFDGNLVCHCFKIAEAEIREAIDLLGAESLEDVMACTQAGTGCTACHCRIRRMLAGQSATCGPLEVCSTCGFNTSLCGCKAA